MEKTKKSALACTGKQEAPPQLQHEGLVLEVLLDRLRAFVPEKISARAVSGEAAAIGSGHENLAGFGGNQRKPNRLSLFPVNFIRGSEQLWKIIFPQPGRDKPLMKGSFKAQEVQFDPGIG